MSHPLAKMIRSAVVDYDTEPLNILTFPTHERYETGICKTGHNFYSLQGGEIKTWKSQYAPIPKNYTIFDGQLGDNQIPLDLNLDLILTQNKFAHFNIAQQLARQLYLPIVTLEHCVPSDAWSQDLLERGKAMISNINIMTTHNGRKLWGFPEDDNAFPVIYHGIDTDLFKPSDVEKITPVLSVCNAMADRPLEVGWDLWQEISNLGAEIDIHPTVKKIEKILNSEKSVLVYSKCRHDAHLYNIVKHTKKSFLCLNVCWNITSEWISKSEFMNYWNCGKKKCGKTEHVIWRVPKTT